MCQCGGRYVKLDTPKKIEKWVKETFKPNTKTPKAQKAKPYLSSARELKNAAIAQQSAIYGLLKAGVTNPTDIRGALFNAGIEIEATNPKIAGYKAALTRYLNASKGK